MEEMILKIGYTDDELCISIPKELLDEEECRVDVAVTPMPGALEVNVLITEPEYEDTDEDDEEDECDGCDYPYHRGFLRM